MYPKQVISRAPWPDIERTFEIVSASVTETDRFVFAVAYCVDVDDALHTVYTLLAFPMEEGIGGRLVHQWNYVYFLGYYAEQAAAEHNMGLTWWREHMADRAEKNALGGRSVVEPRW